MLEAHPNARLIAACVVPLIWMGFSSGLILVNKHLMTDKGAPAETSCGRPVIAAFRARADCAEGNSCALSHDFGAFCSILQRVEPRHIFESLGLLSCSCSWTRGFVPLTSLGCAGFRYPIALSGLGQAFSAVAAFVCCRVLRIVPAEKVVDVRFFTIRMLPVGLCMAVTLMCGNTVYMYLTVAFIQMLKAFTPVITMVGLFLASLEVRGLQLNAPGLVYELCQIRSACSVFSQRSAARLRSAHTARLATDCSQLTLGPENTARCDVH